MCIARHAVVLAAGFGSRLGGKAKPLVKVAGRPLVWYPLSVLHLLGVSEVCLVTRREIALSVRNVAAGVYGGPAVHLVVNEEPERENGYSLLLALRECSLYGERVIVSMSDHIYSPLIPLRVSCVRSRGYVIGVDAEPCCVDVEEATLTAVSGTLISSIGKGLKYWTHVDVGVHLYSYLGSSVLFEASAGMSVVKLNSLAQRLAGKSLLLAADVTGLPWTEIDTPQDLEGVEHGDRRWVVSHVESWLRS